jgi:AMMECR1 domain-containing protein
MLSKLCCLLIACSAAMADMPGVQEPRVTLEQATELVTHARAAMRLFLTDRVTASNYLLPQELRDIQTNSSAVALTIRHQGRHERFVETGRDLAQNVVNAALKAMRSGVLPDVVTPELLESCLLEVEILGPGVVVAKEDIVKTYVQGIVGVRVSRGLDDSYVLPSTACARGLSAEAAVKEALRDLPSTPSAEGLPLRWMVYSTSHYAAFADGQVVCLYRGKLLMPQDLITQQDMNAAARQVGDYLLRCLDGSGVFFLRGGDFSVRDQVYAAYALSRLAESTGDKRYAAGSNLALSNVAVLIRQDETKAWIESDGGSELAATAMLLSQMPESDDKVSPRAKLLRFVLEHPTPPPAEASRAIVALRRAGVEPPNWPVSYSGSDDVEAAWMLRAGIAPAASALPLPVGPEALLDEQGAIAAEGRAPGTVATAIAAAALAEGKSWAGVDALSPDKREQIILSARKFCYQMVYKPRETYYAQSPEGLIGGVRAGPDDGRITLGACAAAIEAFLADPHMEK